MNIWSLEQLDKIFEIIEQKNIKNNQSFDYLRIIGEKDKTIEKEAKNLVFFPVYSSLYDIEDRWINNSYDLRKKMNDIILNNPNYTYVIEPLMLESIENKEAKLLVVNNIMESIDKLYKYQMKLCKPVTVAVTGSVGKTVTVGLIEEVLKTKYNILRLYSKRLTPINIKSKIINMLNPDIDLITTEMSIYYSDHVKVLASLLKPSVSAITNIDSSHLGLDGMNTLKDLCIKKSEILRYAKIGILNGQDRTLMGLELNKGKLFYNGEYLFDTNLEKLIKTNEKEINIRDNKFELNQTQFDPFILTKLALVQYTMVNQIGKFLEVPNNSIVKAFENYKPVENRVQKCRAFSKNIFFDGDVTTNERIKQLSEYYFTENVYLVIRKFGSAENTDRMELVTNSFKKFKKVYLFSDIEYLDVLKNENNVEIVNNHNFMKELNGKIIYHYSGYYRSYDQFNENNLKTLENIKYKILTPQKGVK